MTALLTGFAEAWLSATGRAAWQGGLALLAVWLLCRAFRRLPPAAAIWLWRLAFLKLLVAFFWAAPIAVPLLPPPAPVVVSPTPVQAVPTVEAPALPALPEPAPRREAPLSPAVLLCGA